MELCACVLILYLGPPAGQYKVCVHILLSELFCHVEAERSIFVVDVALGGIRQNGMSVVYFFKLIRRFWVVGILVWVEF